MFTTPRRLKELFRMPVPALDALDRCAEEAAYRAERDRIESEWNLPACDVFRENAEPLVDAVLEMLKD